MINPIKIQMSSDTASLKLLEEGTGTMFIPSTSSQITITSTIPHNFNNDNLIWQVVITWTDIPSGASTNVITPWSTGDGRLNFVSHIDSNNLYIIGYAETAGSPTDAVNVTYFYRILVP